MDFGEISLVTGENSKSLWHFGRDLTKLPLTTYSSLD